jgi:hypothetical protein
MNVFQDADCHARGRSTLVGFTDIHVRGRKVRTPSVCIDQRTVVVTGTLLGLATVHDGPSMDAAPSWAHKAFLDRLGESGIGADIFSFAQRLPDTAPRFDYPYELDNSAAIPVTTYDSWFKDRTAADVRQNVRRALKSGVSVRIVPFDDALVSGIVDIYNESPVRQGRPFWHYGKSFATVKAETSHALDRSHFLGAYWRDELIGFAKLLRIDATADLVLIVSKLNHQERRPSNALIAKAVEFCAENHIPYLTYARLTYGKKAHSSLAEFKRRNGFEQIPFPRYFIPLTLKGRIATRFRLYRELKDLLPERMMSAATKVRALLHHA